MKQSQQLTPAIKITHNFVGDKNPAERDRRLTEAARALLGQKSLSDEQWRAWQIVNARRA